MKSSNWQPPSLSSKTTPSVSTSYDFSRCPETQKLKSVCLCDSCKDGPDLKAIAEQDAAWAAKKRAEKFAELDEIRRSSEAPGGGSSLAAAATAARAEMPAGIKAAALAARQENCASRSKADGEASTAPSASRPNAPVNTYGRDRSYLFASEDLPSTSEAPVTSPTPDSAAGAAPEEEWELVEEAKPLAKTTHGNTALHVAAALGNIDDVVRVLDEQVRSVFMGCVRASVSSVCVWLI